MKELCTDGLNSSDVESAAVNEEEDPASQCQANKTAPVAIAAEPTRVNVVPSVAVLKTSGH